MFPVRVQSTVFVQGVNKRRAPSYCVIVIITVERKSFGATKHLCRTASSLSAILTRNVRHSVLTVIIDPDLSFLLFQVNLLKKNVTDNL